MVSGVEDITHLIGKEEGSAFDQESLLFGDFNEGGVFVYDDADIRETKDMLKVDGKAQTLESVLTLPLRAAPWWIGRGQSTEAVHDRIQHLLTDPANLGGMTTPMNLIIAQMTNAIVYRKAYFEKVWAVKLGGVGYDKLGWRPPNTCAITRDPKTGAFMGFRQMPIRAEDTDEVKFIPQRSFVYIHGTHRDPLDGVSDLTVTRWCFKTKQKIRFLWYSFLEGQSLPKTIAQANDETTAQEAAKKVVGLRQGGVVGLSNQVELGVLESSGKGADQFKAAMQWLDSEASSSVLAPFTDLGAAAVQGVGSFALSKDQTDFFQLSEQAKSREMADFINNYLIADLVRWNFGPNEMPPVFEFGPINQDDATQAISLLQATAQVPAGTSILPFEFFSQLAERVAGLLDLDVQVVRKALTEHADKVASMAPPGLKPEVVRAAGQTDGAERMVRAGADGKSPLQAIAGG